MVDQLLEIPLPGRIAASAGIQLTSETNCSALPAFIAGPENRLIAATVDRLLAASSPDGFAPHVLALFGPSGVGKTHLARGIVRHWQQRFGESHAHYMTAADFRRELHVSVESGAVEAFRERIRGYQLLTIDDIHRLPSREFLAHELRYTLDAFEEADGTIIVTADRPPDALGNVTADVRSRLASGLVLQLAAPGKAARARLIRHASAAFGRPTLDEAMLQLADNAHRTAPQVFGALFETWAAPQADRRLRAGSAHGAPAVRASRQPTLAEIISIVAKYMRVSQKLLKSASRRQSVVFARAIVIYLARELTDSSYEQIGRALGGRDHTTIMHSHQKIDRERLLNPATQQSLDDLRRILCSR